MKSRTMLCVTLLVIFVSLLVSACFGGWSAITSRGDFSAETSTLVHELPVASRYSSNSLSVELNLDAGQVVFRLSSPDGQVQWEEAFTAPADYRHVLDLAVTPGTWKLTNERKDATGDYDIEWKAR